MVAPNGQAALVFGAAPVGCRPRWRCVRASGPPSCPTGGPLQPSGRRVRSRRDHRLPADRHPPSSAEPLAWEGVAPELAKRLDRVVRRALDPDPARRPATAGGLLDRLVAAREGALPAGVVTFVLTDIEGSTVLWESHPTVMAEVIARHHQLVADIAEDHRGHMPRSQGEGDSTLSAFGRATDAVAAALAVQRALATEPWPEAIQLRVRAGMHTGEAQVDGGDYFGAAVNRAARVRGLAAGGQVLLSRATAELVMDHLPDGVTLLDLGSHTLKGLARDEQVYELCSEDLPRPAPAESVPAAWPDLRLPAGLAIGSRNVRRPRRRARAARRVVATRASTPQASVIVLVAGEPGIGKTWLTAEFARRAASVARPCSTAAATPRTCCRTSRSWKRSGSTCAPDRSPGAVQSHAHGANLTRLVPTSPAISRAPRSDRAEPDTERYLMFEAVNQLLVDLADDAPVLVLLEDLHWADRPTLALLAHLARGTEATPILVLGTYRGQGGGR